MVKSARSRLVMLALVLVVCLGTWIVESQTKFFRRIYDDVILDNRNHYLSCERLPSEEEVRRVMEEYQDTIEKIEQINPSFVGAEIDTSTCPGKADIIFWYGTHQDKLLIENIIANDTFYEVPYRLQNR
jgi:hypothetical protein